MSELTDFEICKRIAEIEGAACHHDAYTGTLFVKDLDGRISINGVSCSEFNPLTDKALCFDLMVVYGVDIDFYTSTARIQSAYTDRPDIAVQSFDDNSDSACRAICLAIIEKHN